MFIRYYLMSILKENPVVDIRFVTVYGFGFTSTFCNLVLNIRTSERRTRAVLALPFTRVLDIVMPVWVRHNLINTSFIFVISDKVGIFHIEDYIFSD